MDEIRIRAKIVKGDPPIMKGGLLNLQIASIEYATLLTDKLKGYKGQELTFTVTDCESWTSRMNRLFHALVRDIQKAGAVQFWQLLGRAPSGFDEVKEWCKVQFGGAEVMIVGSLSFIKSWTDFGKKQACTTIDNMISYCLEQGVEIDASILERDNLKEGK